MVRVAIRSALLFLGIVSVAYGVSSSAYYILLGSVFIGLYSGWPE